MKYVFKTTLFLLCGVVVFLAASLPNSDGEGYDIGDVASDFELMNVDGKMVSLADYPEANGFIVIFTCNTCPFSVRYEDRIIELHNTFASQGYPVIAINPNDPEVKPGDSFDEMVVRANEKGFEFPYLFDEDQQVYPVYGATRTPHVYLLDGERTVKYIGAIDDNARDEDAVEENYIEMAIVEMANGQDPEPATTKAIGCTIKTK